MKYLAYFYPPGSRQPSYRPYKTLDGALRLLVRGMDEGSLWPLQIETVTGRLVASYDWILDHWPEVLDCMNAGQRPTAGPPGDRLI